MTWNAPPSLPPPPPNNRDVDGYICIYLLRDAFSGSLVTLFQRVIHVDECINKKKEEKKIIVKLWGLSALWPLKRAKKKIKKVSSSFICGSGFKHQDRRKRKTWNWCGSDIWNTSLASEGFQAAAGLFKVWHWCRPHKNNSGSLRASRGNMELKSPKLFPFLEHYFSSIIKKIQHI